MRLTILKGVEGYCITLDDFRIAGPKPWGGGTIIQEWEVSRALIYQALGEDDIDEEAAHYPQKSS